MNDKTKEIARKILHEQGYTEETYQGIGKDIILDDLRTTYPDGLPDGTSYEEVTDVIYQISTVDSGWRKPVHYKIPDGHDNASHHGLTDLYPEVRKNLEEIISKGFPFETESLTSKNAIAEWKMSRSLTGGNIYICVTRPIDKGADLADDVLPEGIELSEEEMEKIMNAYVACRASYSVMSYNEVSGNCSLDDILAKVEELYNETDVALEKWHKQMKEAVEIYLEQRNAKQQKEGEQ